MNVDPRNARQGRPDEPAPGDPGESTLRQRADIVSEGGAPRLNAKVPALDLHVLVLNRKGSGRLYGRIGDRAYTSWRQNGQITFIPAGMVIAIVERPECATVFIEDEE